MDCHGASKKKATEEDVRKMAKGLTLDHDKVAGAGSLLDAAQNFRSGSGMEGLTSILGDVQALLPESDAEDGPEQEGEEAAEEGEDEEGKDQEELVTKKQKWFDRDRAVSKANKILVATYDKMFKTSTTELDKMEKMLKDYDGLTPSERKQLEGDVTILRSRLACLQAVHGTDDALKRLIAEVERAGEKTAASPPSSASSAADPMRGLGRAPPCGSYKKLRTMQAWRNHADSVLECQTLAEIEKVKSDAADYKNPIADLVAASKTASSDVSKGLKALQAARKLQQEKEPSGKSARKKASAALSGPPVFDLAEHCKPITVLAENEPIPDLSYPALIQTLKSRRSLTRWSVLARRSTRASWSSSTRWPQPRRSIVRTRSGRWTVTSRMRCKVVWRRCCPRPGLKNLGHMISRILCEPKLSSWQKTAGKSPARSTT